MNPRNRCLIGLVIWVVSTGCGPQAQPTPDMAATESAITRNVLATLTASAPTPTRPPAPTGVTPEPPAVATAPPTDPPAPAAAVVLPTVTPLPPTPVATATPSGPEATVTSASLNVRGGPGTDFPIVAAAGEGDRLAITGRNEDGSWLEIVTPDGVQGWVSATLVAANLEVTSVAIAQVIPAPPPTATLAPVSIPAPISTPLPAAQRLGLHERQTIGHWEIQPERLHREKTVYWSRNSYTAMGTYAIVIVLAKNLAPGTDSMNSTLWMALRDDQGREYDYSDPLTVERSANLAAAWEFVVHPIPFSNVDPGYETPLLMLWDVREDVQSLTLLIGDGLNVAEWDLGDFANIPPFTK